MNFTDLDEFERGYIECALWLADEDPPPGEWPYAEEFFDQLAPETLERLRKDCRKFCDDAKIVACIADRESEAGHDFWLTRNGHGAGFWDGDWPEPDSDYLSNRARSSGSLDLYRGDDGLIYAM